MENSQNDEVQAKNAVELNELLLKTITELRMGKIELQKARAIGILADRSIRLSTKHIQNKKLTGHSKTIQFLEDGLREEDK